MKGSHTLKTSFRIILVLVTALWGLTLSLDALAASSSAPIYPGAVFGEPPAVMTAAFGLQAGKVGFVPGAYVDMNGDGKIDAVGFGTGMDSSGNTFAKVIVALGNADGTFGARQTYDIDSSPGSLHVADLNGDGHPDVVVFEADSQGYYSYWDVLINNGDGTLQPAQKVTTTLTEYTASFVVHDINNDGIPDLVTFGASFLGKGDGTFGAAVGYTLLGSWTNPVVIVADFDNDGKPDLIITDTSNGDYAVLPGNGDGTFGSEHDGTPLNGGNGIDAIRAYDINADGNVDLIDVSSDVNTKTSTVAVLLGNGDRTFKSPITSPIASAVAFPDARFALGDFNNDGVTDLAIPETHFDATGRTMTSAYVGIALGNGDGTFNDQGAYAAPLDYDQVFTTDLDGDGNADILVGGSLAGADYDFAVLKGHGDGTFYSRTVYAESPQNTSSSGGAQYTDIHLGDIDGDGDQDIVVSYPDANAVCIFQNDGRGAFTPLANLDIGSRPYALAVADLNGDGLADIVVSDGTYPSLGADVFFSNGDGTFGSPVHLNSAYGSIVIGDMNGDGKPDIVVAGGSEIDVFLNKGSEQFGGALSYTVQSSHTNFNADNHFAALGDFDGDGNLDLALAGDPGFGNTGPNVVVLHGTGTGSFDNETELGSGSAVAQEVFVGDINNDGKLDIVTANVWEDSSFNEYGSYSVYMGNGDGTFGSDIGTTVDPTYENAGLALADINGDGHLDMVMSGLSNIYTFLGNGDGTFTKSFLYSAGFNPAFAMAVGDLDGNGTPDIALPQIVPNGVSVLLSSAAPMVTNTPAVASDSSLSTNENTAASGTLKATDADGDTLTFSIVTKPAHGTISIDNYNTGAYTYTPNTGYSGSDSFTFKANDGQADSNTATVSITVKATSSSSGGTSNSSGNGSTSSTSSSGSGAAGPIELLLLSLLCLIVWYRRRPSPQTLSKILDRSVKAIPNHKALIQYLAILLGSAVLAACGGGGSSASTSQSQSLPPPVTLQSIKVNSNNPYVSTGESLQLAAQATFSDASTKDVTGSVTWSSSDSSVATIDSSGSAKGVAPGTADITATYQGKQASMSLTVGDQVGGVGATVPWVEYEAEDGTTNGTIIGPSRTQGDMAAEASGRRAVKLDQTGQYVRFTTTARANSIVVRYVIPDSAGGGGINATLGLYVNGTRVQSLSLTSKYAWLYSANNSSTFWTDNTPGADPHHFYDEVHALTAQIPAGATVTLQKDSQDTAAYYVIDLVDLEQVAAPLSQPAGSISITDYGAVPNDGVDDSAAIQQAVDNAQSQGKTLWIPAGTFTMDSAQLFTQSIKIQGAGMWYSVLSGANAGIITSGSNNQFSDFAIFGDQTARASSGGVNGFSGTEGTGSSIKNVWVEHEQVGAWIVGTDNPLPGSTVPQTTDGLLISGVRFRDTYADGMDFASGTSNSTINQSTFRNTGDDSMGAYSAPDGSKADSSDTFQFNTVQAPWVAHCMAAYGGKDITFEDNVCTDSDEGGIALAAAFNAYAFAGTTTIQRNSLIRICSDEFDGRTCGALTLSPGEKAIANTTVIKDLLIQDPTSDGILVTGPNTLSGVTFDNVQVTNAGADGIYINSDAVGSGAATALIVTSPTGTGLDDLSNGNWTLTSNKWNSGW